MVNPFFDFRAEVSGGTRLVGMLIYEEHEYHFINLMN